MIFHFAICRQAKYHIIMVIATFFRNIVIIKKEYVKDSSYGTNGMTSIYYKRDEMCEKT